MSVDLGSPVVEVALALAFVFFLLSLLVSAGTELVAALTRQRAKNLVAGIEGLLGDEAMARRVVAHPLVRTDLTKSAGEDMPSYVSARNFALALTQSLRADGRAAAGGFEQVRDAIGEMSSDSPLGAQLQALLADAEADATAFGKGVEAWFDDAMDRVSGWYKRWSQRIAIGFAILVTVGLNANAIRIAERLNADPAVRAAVVARAEGAKSGEATATGERVEAAYSQLEGLGLPLLWGSGNVPSLSVADLALTAAGWLITIAAISLGAPFWFDTLSRLARLRSTGRRPGEGGAAPQAVQLEVSQAPPRV